MKYYKLWIAVVSLSFCIPPASGASDPSLTAIKFYGYAKGGGVIYSDKKEIEVKKGSRFEFHEYRPLHGLDPDLIDVGISVSNNSTQAPGSVEIRIVIAPKVSSIVFIPKLAGSGMDPRTADRAGTYETAEWFAPIVLLRKTVKIAGGSNKEVTFEKINLQEIIRSYVKRKLWPSECG